MTFWFEKYNMKFGIQLKMSHTKVKVKLVVTVGRLNIFSQGL